MEYWETNRGKVQYRIRRSPLSCVCKYILFLFFTCVCSSYRFMTDIFVSAFTIIFVHSKCIGMSGLFQLSSIDSCCDCVRLINTKHIQTRSHIHTYRRTGWLTHAWNSMFIPIWTNYLIAYIDAVILNWYQNWIHICFFFFVVVVVGGGGGVAQIIHTVFARIMMARQQHNDVVEFMINLYKDAEPSRLSTIAR